MTDSRADAAIWRPADPTAGEETLLGERRRGIYLSFMIVTREWIATLAPSTFESGRSSRYRADDQAIPLEALERGDRELVVWLYGYLRELDGVVQDEATAQERLTAFREQQPIGDVVERIRRLGAKVTDERIAEALHDVRGGALTVLFVQLSRTGRAPYRAEVGRSLFLAARDHLKMMRNVVLDLDLAARERDLSYREHSLDDLASAFRNFAVQQGDRHVHVEVDCPAEAVIAQSCVEFGAIDRVTYNLLNNAARHSADSVIRAFLMRLERDLRVVVANAVTAEQRTRLEQQQLSGESLFGRFTTTGSGYGLRIVSELVGRAYGIASDETLERQGYMGARVVGDEFVAWFHWPLSDV